MIVDLLSGDFFVTLGFVAMVAMMKFVGPMVRIRRFLYEVASGKEAQPLKLRKRDEIGEWLPLINEATRLTRERNAERAPVADENETGEQGVDEPPYLVDRPRRRVAHPS